ALGNLDGASVGNQASQLGVSGVIFSGQITIVKSADPLDGTSFNFSATNLSPTSFSLTASGPPLNTHTFPNITNFSQSFTVTETLPASPWFSTGVVCVINPGGSNTSAFNYNGTNQAVITLGNGDPVTCTYTNKKAGHIIIKKVTEPSTDTTNSFT